MGRGQKTAAALVTALSVLAVCVLLVFPEQIGALINGNLAPAPAAVSDERFLSVREDTVTYSGVGTFDPLDNVTAKNSAGEDLSGQVAVAYVPTDIIGEKTIRYTLHTEDGGELTASCRLILEHYRGPSITLDEIDGVEPSQLDSIVSVLAEQGRLHADDGFGNDAAGSVSGAYTVDEASATAALTLSLTNQFNDFVLEERTVPLANAEMR